MMMLMVMVTGTECIVHMYDDVYASDIEMWRTNDFHIYFLISAFNFVQLFVGCAAPKHLNNLNTIF